MTTNRKRVVQVLGVAVVTAGFVVAGVASSSAEDPTMKRDPASTGSTAQDGGPSEKALAEAAASAQRVENAKAGEIAPQAMADTLYLLNAITRVTRP
jgi:hypothetical protein